MTKPYIGQQVNFYGMPCGIGPQYATPPTAIDYSKCMTAVVVYVWGDACVNLSVSDHQGNVYPVACAVYCPEEKRLGEVRGAHATPLVASA